jgi:hypothetical protein
VKSFPVQPVAQVLGQASIQSINQIEPAMDSSFKDTCQQAQVKMRVHYPIDLRLTNIGRHSVFMPFSYACMRAHQLAHLNRPCSSHPVDPSSFCASANEVPRDPMHFKFDSYSVLVDDGASHSFTNCKADFVAHPQPFHWHAISSKTSQASHIGTVQWSWTDENG